MKNGIRKISKSSRLLYISAGVIIGVIITVVLYLIPSKNTTPYYPLSSFALASDNYQAVYDARTKAPIWVCSSISNPYESLVQNKVKIIASNSKIPSLFQTHETDYTDHSYIPEQLAIVEPSSSDSYLSTCVALTPKFANGYWKNFKTYLQKELNNSSCESIDVFIGPLFLVSEQSQTMEYKLIGSSKIAVPTHLFVVLKYCLHAVKSKAYIIPTNLEPSKHSFEDLEVSFAELERKAGLLFSDEITNPKPTPRAPGL